MRNLPGVLVFSTALLFAVGCHKNTGEAPGPGDAAADPRGAMDAVKDAGVPTESGQTGTSRGALTSEDAGSEDAGSAKTDSGTGTSMKGTTGASREAMESCVDRWLQSKGLDKYGHPEGTMYAGGTPLFDERTGESTDRLDYIFKRKPEAREACAGKAPTK